MQQDPAVAELLLELQGIHVRKPQLRRGLAGSPLHDGLERGELGGHAGRGQEHVVFRAVVKPGELPAQGLADTASSSAIGARPARCASACRVETISPVCCQNARKAGVPASLVTTPWMPRNATTLACSPLVRSMNAGAQPGGAERWKRQARPPVADLPCQFLHLRHG